SPTYTSRSGPGVHTEMETSEVNCYGTGTKIILDPVAHFLPLVSGFGHCCFGAGDFLTFRDDSVGSLLQNSTGGAVTYPYGFGVTLSVVSLYGSCRSYRLAPPGPHVRECSL